MRQSQTLRIETQAFLCQLSGDEKRSNRDYDPRHDDMLDGSGVVVERSLVGVVGEPHAAIPEIFHVGQSRYENVGDYSRLHKLKFHDGFPSSSHRCLARSKDRANRGAATSSHEGNITPNCAHSYRAVNGGVS